MVTGAITKATIETLTAEVRVLMVGSRQVTLSVARQLDTVDLWDIEPFGRVRMDKYELHNFGDVIGRKLNSQDLVIASYAKINPTWPFERWWLNVGTHGYSQLDWDNRREFYNLSRDAEKLPLIVLAGLR